MASTMIYRDETREFELPLARSFDEFRAWTTSIVFPEDGRIDYITGDIEVDMAPEDLYTHAAPKIEMIVALGTKIKTADLGELYSDRVRVSSPQAELSAEPDLVFVSWESYQTGRVKRVQKASGEARRFVELEGGPDLVLEIASDSSVTKDLRRLPKAYWQAGVGEFWFADARGEEFVFQIHHRGPPDWHAAARDADGYQFSVVFQSWFRILRQTGKNDSWTYTLQEKQALSSSSSGTV